MMSVVRRCSFLDGISADKKGIAMPHRLLVPQAVSTGGFLYQKVFGEEAFAAAGIIRIPLNSKKPGKSSKDNAFVSHEIVALVMSLKSSSFSSIKVE